MIGSQRTYKIPRNHFFGFLQVRHFVKSNLKLPNVQPMLSPIESFLLHFNLNTLNDKKCISLFYEELMPFNSANSDRARDLWEKDLEVELSTEAWSNALCLLRKYIHATDSGRVNIEYYTEYKILLNFYTK